MSASSNSIPRAARTGQRRLLTSLSLLLAMFGGTWYFAGERVRELMQIGVDDHIACAIRGTYPRQNDRAAMIEALGPYSLMLQPIFDQFGGDTLVSAHRCTANDRSYMHIIIRHDQTLISVMMTRRNKDETFPRLIGGRTFQASGITVHSGEAGGYAVGVFDAGNYLAYVISGLPGQQNDRLAGRVAPVIKRYTGS